MTKQVYIIIAFLTLAFAMVFYWFYSTTPKVAYIRTGTILEQYVGMKEAAGEYEKKKISWESKVDSLKSILKMEIIKYKQDSAKLSRNELIARATYIDNLKRSYIEYSSQLSEKAKKEDQQMSDRVINQINSFIEEYGKKKGYDIVIGTTDAGNLLYGSKRFDITDEILEAMNDDYKNGSSK